MQLCSGMPSHLAVLFCVAAVVGSWRGAILEAWRLLIDLGGAT